MGLMEDYIVEEVRGRMDRQFYEDMDKLKSTWNVIQKAKSSRDICQDVARVRSYVFNLHPDKIRIISA